MHSKLILLVSTLLFTAIRTLTVPPLTTINNATSASPDDSASNSLPDLTKTNAANADTLNFLGVSCYHLDPATDSVSLLSCQPLFANIFRKGHVQDMHYLYNGWSYRYMHGPCIIKISSADPKEGYRSVALSMATLVEYASEVLRDCKTGGANTFEGSWQVVVTRNKIESVAANGTISEE